MTGPDDVQRSSLPIPDLAYTGTVTYDATSPDTHVPADPAAAAARGRAERAGDPDRRRRLRRVERVRRAVRDADVRAAGRRRPEVHPVPHHGAVLADAGRAAVGTQPPHGRHGRHHRDRHLGARATTRCGPTRARRSPRSCKLNGYNTAQFGKCHEVPVWEANPTGPVRPLAAPGRRVRVLLRVHRRRDEPVVPERLREHDAGRSVGHARGGLPLHGRHDRQGDRVDPPAEVARPGQAVLHLLRARAPRTRPHHVPTEWADRYAGQFDQGWDADPRGDVRPAEGARRDPRRRRAHRAQRRHPGVGRDVRRRSSRCSPGRWRCTPGSCRTPTTTSAG